MNNTRKLFELLTSAFSDINIKELYIDFENNLSEIYDSSEMFDDVFYGTTTSESNKSLENMRIALDEMKELPDILFKMLEYDHSVRLSDLQCVYFITVPLFDPNSLPGPVSCPYDTYKKLSISLIKSIYLCLEKWDRNQRIFCKYLHHNYGDCFRMDNVMHILCRINKITIQWRKIKEVLKLNNIQIE